MSTVLVIDDTVDCAEPLAKLLRKVGHTVRTAYNGREAIAVLEYFHPDSIILDLMMPVMDGVTFLEHIRRDPAWANVRVIVFTGDGDALRTRRLAKLGVSKVMLKASIDYKHLAELVA